MAWPPAPRALKKGPHQFEHTHAKARKRAVAFLREANERGLGGQFQQSRSLPSALQSFILIYLFLADRIGRRIDCERERGALGGNVLILRQFLRISRQA